jgi:Flp pilus assembly protein TadB
MMPVSVSIHDSPENSTDDRTRYLCDGILVSVVVVVVVAVVVVVVVVIVVPAIVVVVVATTVASTATEVYAER